MTRAPKSTGERIALHRRKRGLSQPMLAALVGRSESWLSQVERGLRTVENLRVISRVAEVLDVAIEDITGQPLRLGPDAGQHFAGLSALTAALTMAGPQAVTTDVDSSGRTRSLQDLRGDIATMHRLYQSARFSEEAALLPALVTEAAIAVERAKQADHREALALLADVHIAAAALLRKVSEHDVAWLAADRALRLSEQADDPLMMAAAAYRLAHIFLRGDRLTQTEAMVDWGLSLLSDANVPEARSLRGALFLTAAVCAARHDDRVGALQALARADIEAHDVGDRNDFWTAFGPSNVAIHRISVEVELGDPSKAVRAASAIDLESVPVELLGRRSQILVDLARARMLLKDHSGAIQSLATAEKIAPQSVRHSNIARDIVRQAVSAGSTPSAVQDLARRMAVPV